MTKEKIFSDLADLAGGAASMFSTFRDQIRNDVKDRVDEWAEQFDLVTRADVTRLEGMIEKLRAQIDALQKNTSGTKQSIPKKTSKSTAQKQPKKTTSKTTSPSKSSIKKTRAQK